MLALVETTERPSGCRCRNMHLIWAWILVVCTVSCSTAERGSSLRGALEALQRRQRGRTHTQFAQPDYDSVYEYVPPQSYPGTK